MCISFAARHVEQQQQDHCTPQETAASIDLLIDGWGMWVRPPFQPIKSWLPLRHPRLGSQPAADHVDDVDDVALQQPGDLAIVAKPPMTPGPW